MKIEIYVLASLSKDLLQFQISRARFAILPQAVLAANF
jgi:hypothetical protein